MNEYISPHSHVRLTTARNEADGQDLLRALGGVRVDLVTERILVLRVHSEALLVVGSTLIAASPMPIVLVRHSRVGDAGSTKVRVRRITHARLVHGTRARSLELACRASIGLRSECTVIIHLWCCTH